MCEENKQNKKKKLTNLLIVIGGILIGAANGFFGGGGGMICVPVLKKTLEIEDKEAHATAIAVMLPLSVVSALIYILKGAFDSVGLWIGLGVVGGGALGAFLLSKVSNKFVSMFFSLVVIAAGVKSIWF
ncbi:MAG: TSUP family transporter [Christensenellales bacterium]